jgi:hypothetical protein
MQGKLGVQITFLRFDDSAQEATGKKYPTQSAEKNIYLFLFFADRIVLTNGLGKAILEARILPFF